jgi:hypothetical protein
MIGFVGSERVRDEVKDEKFLPQRSNDALSASLGTPEHLGRLRGHSQGYIGMKIIFEKEKRKATSHVACDERINSVSKFTKLSHKKY